MKTVLFVFIIAYICTVFIARTLIVWKKTGSFPITYSTSGSTHDFLGRVFKALILLSLISPLAYIFSSNYYEYLSPIQTLVNSKIQIIGIMLAYGSMLWTIVAQAQMGNSWRIGIDYSEKELELVHSGLFKHSRHPIYAGVMTTSFSLLLVLPNALTFGIFCTTWLTLVIQAKLEEDYLTKTHKDSYTQYIKETRRWV